MGLLGEVQAEQRGRSRPGLRCIVQTVRGELKGQDAKDFEALLTDPSVYSTAIARALQARGFDVARGSIQRHRRGECGCARR